jgi:NADH dehydrogenase
VQRNELSGQTSRIVILGGGFAGAYAIKASSKYSATGTSDVLLIDRNNYLLFYPLLVEAGVGAIEARHVVVPIRKFLKRERFLMAEVLEVDLPNKNLTVRIEDQDELSNIYFDHLVIGLGSVTKVPDIPGLKEQGFMVKTLDDAIDLRDRAIRLLELANTVRDAEKRRELLNVVTVGANYTGVEFAGEFHSFLLEASEAYPNVSHADIGMTLLEYSDKILSGTTPKLASWCHSTLEARGIKIQTGTTITEVAPDHVVTTRNERIPCRTVVWTAGINPNPLLPSIKGLPLNAHGYIDCNPDLSVKGYENVWAIGDAATVIGPNGKPFPATAQTASREGPAVMKNIDAKIKGEPTTSFDYRMLGAFAAIGRRQAAADVLGIQLTWFLGWIMYRGTYLMKMPSLGMKMRLLADWTTEIVFRNEPVQLGLKRYRDGRQDRLL